MAAVPPHQAAVQARVAARTAGCRPKPSRALPPGSCRRAGQRSAAATRQKNTGLSRSELRPVDAGLGCAMERAVREGDTGLHHTARTRRCLQYSEPANWFWPRQWSVSAATFEVTERFAAGGDLRHRHRHPLHTGQASQRKARVGEAEFAALSTAFQHRRRRFSTGSPPLVSSPSLDSPCHGGQGHRNHRRRWRLEISPQLKKTSGRPASGRRTTAGTSRAGGRCPSRAACA
jgi:hypothetical protein